jgi:hypothetical protein
MMIKSREFVSGIRAYQKMSVGMVYGMKCRTERGEDVIEHEFIVLGWRPFARGCTQLCE